MSDTQHDRWLEFGASDAEISAAVVRQRGSVMRMLGSRRWEAEDVMAQLALDMVVSMPRWAKLRPRPELGAWAHGVAVRTFYTWIRSTGTGQGPGGAAMLSSDDLAEHGFDLVAPARDFVDAGPSVRTALVKRLRQAVMMQPGGAATWDALVTTDGRVRGSAALAQLRLLLEVADPSGTLRRTAGLTQQLQRGDAGATNAA